MPASQPQTMLPSVMLPKNTARLTASPRERTQPGSAIWAETLRLESTAIQASPASTQAGKATANSGNSASSAIASASAAVPGATVRSAPSRAFSGGSSSAPATAPVPTPVSSAP